jgi:hypothetical protein
MRGGGGRGGGGGGGWGGWGGGGGGAPQLFLSVKAVGGCGCPADRNLRKEILLWHLRAKLLGQPLVFVAFYEGPTW